MAVKYVAITIMAAVLIVVAACSGRLPAGGQEPPDARYTVRPGSSRTFSTPPLSFADRLDCEERFSSRGHHLQKPNDAGTRCTYGATELHGQRNFQRTACQGPFVHGLERDYGKLDPDEPESALNKIARPNGGRWTVSVPDDTQIGEVFIITITIEGVMDIYFDDRDDGLSRVTQGAVCERTKTVEVKVVAPRANHEDTAPLAAARAARPVASSGDYVPPNTSRCTVVQFNRPSPRQYDNPSSTSFMSWCGDLGEYAPNGRRLDDLCAEADVDCRRY